MRNDQQSLRRAGELKGRVIAHGRRDLSLRAACDLFKPNRAARHIDKRGPFEILAYVKRRARGFAGCDLIGLGFDPEFMRLCGTRNQDLCRVHKRANCGQQRFEGKHNGPGPNFDINHDDAFDGAVVRRERA